MTTADYRSALAAAIKEYEALGEQRRDIDARLSQLAQTIGTLSRLLGMTPTVPLSITEAVRLAMRSGVPMTPLDVRERFDAYIAAWEEVIHETSTDSAPWHVVPADRNWVKSTAVATLLVDTLERLDPSLPDPEPGIEGLVIQ